MIKGKYWRAGVAAAAVLCVAEGGAQASYPDRPIRLIVPYSAGGATDVVTRIIAGKLPEVLGQQVVIDNRAGAGSLIGTEIAARAPADGYTLFSAGTPHVIVPHLYQKVAYDPLADFVPIMQFGSQPYVLTIHPSLGVKTVAELIDLAKKQPGKINYASSGNGGAQHLFAAMFVSMARIDMVHIPYKGSGPARAELLGGQVKVGCLGISSVIGNHRAGQLRILGVTSARRSPQLPDIPSIGETLPGYDATLWSGLLAPKGTPPAVVKRIHDEVSRLAARPDVKAAFEASGTDIVITTPGQFTALLKVELEKWGRIVREVKLQIN